MSLAAIVMTTAGLLLNISSGFGEVWFFLALLGCIVSVVGVIWIGWFVFELSENLTSITRHVRRDTPIGCKSDYLPIFSQLIQICGSKLDKENNDTDSKCNCEDLKIKIRLAERREKNLQAIIYSISDAVIVIDESDRLVLANEVAGKLFNFDFRNSENIPIHQLINPDESEIVSLLRKSRKSKIKHTRQEIDIDLGLEDQNPHTFDCILSCVNDDSDNVCGVVAVLHDITREKEISRMKTDFVSHVSHELKTPLASITAYSEMLVDGEAEDEQTRNKFYSVIQSQAQRLSRLIEDILNISRIESGLIKIDKKPVSLTILVEDQLEMIRGFAEEKNIEIIRSNPVVFDQVYVDKDMMSQVIVNLLSNAVKYTHSNGKVTIETEVDDTAGLVRLKIIDTGVGIPENEIEHVFDKFYRVSANNKCAKGTGLGLNLVKQIIEKVHEGKVFVESKVNVGSTFGFELPLAAVELAGKVSSTKY
jgi:two-component system phosphate regulon sensor histidine kinase PhoR